MILWFASIHSCDVYVEQLMNGRAERLSRPSRFVERISRDDSSSFEVGCIS
jgi:hypothetical protein